MRLLVHVLPSLCAVCPPALRFPPTVYRIFNVRICTLIRRRKA